MAHFEGDGGASAARLEKGDGGTKAEKAAFTLADARPSDLPLRTTAVGPTDLKIEGDLPVPPQSEAERRQEFADAVGQLNRLYVESTNNPKRMATFQERMAGVYTSDYPTFKAMEGLGKEITADPPATAERAGERVAQILKEAMERKSNPVDLDSPEMQNLQGALVGMMLAERATFDPPNDAAQTKQMVDALDNEFQELGVPYVRGIIWGDTKEPGMAVVPPGMTIDRHNYM